MNVIPMANSENRYKYYRCLKNERSEQYTNIVCGPEHVAFLREHFYEVTRSDNTLPAWRLYELKAD